MSRCMNCDKELTFNEIGAHKRFINRGSTSFYCLDCLAARLKVSPTLLAEKIEYLKQQGCLLFR